MSDDEPGGFALDVAGPDDLDALLALERAVASHPWTRAHFEAALRDPATRVLVLRRPGAAGESGPGVAALCVLARAADEAEVHAVAVDPGLRRRGLARRLLRAALERAARDGARVAFLEVRAGNAAALALYRGLGFAEAGRRRGYYEAPAEDALVLRRNLEFPGGAC